MTFTLLGVPGLESQHLWLSVPFTSMLLAILIGNGAILFLVITEPTLHTPMYLLLALLMVADLISTLALVPKVLCLFCVDDRVIAIYACFTQMFFIHGASVVRSALLVAMAFDRFVAVCEPLRYNTILSHSVFTRDDAIFDEVVTQETRRAFNSVQLIRIWKASGEGVVALQKTHVHGTQRKNAGSQVPPPQHLSDLFLEVSTPQT